MAGSSNRRNRKHSAAARARAENVDLGALATALSESLGMAVDVRKLRPSELVQVLNSTPRGVVIDAARLRRHRNDAGLRIGDGKTIDLLRYVAWLFHRRHAASAPTSAGAPGYEAFREKKQQRFAELSRSARDIGELPAVADAARREQARLNFRHFCEQYFPQTFNLPWAEDHLKVLAVTQRVVLEGGLFAEAMPRGFGKTSICEVAAIWAVIYAHRPFAVVIGPDEGHAIDRVENIRTELEGNARLLEDFPEVCLPIQRLEGVNQRRLLYRGKPIRMEFTAKRIVLPELEGSQAAGAVIATAGITGQIRGLNYKRVDGTVQRPSLVILDDPQTDESAHSPAQCAQRERIINGAVLGLAGPKTRIAALMPCTVIRNDDLADRILDRDRNPQWQGERTKMVYVWPTNEALWRQYVEIRKAAQRAGQDLPVDATEFYQANREAMDAGAVVAWEANFNPPDDISALQHAWNIRADRGDEAFFAECQNEPIRVAEDDAPRLTEELLATKLAGLRRRVLPVATEWVTCFIDVHDTLLFWAAVGWAPGFSGIITDYGTWPEQRAAEFSVRKPLRSLAAHYHGCEPEAAIRVGLVDLIKQLTERTWTREDGLPLLPRRILVDGNYKTDIVHDVCMHTPSRAVLTPSRGLGVKAVNRPLSEYRREPGELRGEHLRLLRSRGRAIRTVQFDANWWKSFIANRLLVPLGGASCLSLFGQRDREHALFFRHLLAETSTRVSAPTYGRVVDEWSIQPGRSENHWWDCLVGCAVGASLESVTLPLPEGVVTKPKGRRRTMREMQEAARRKRAVSEREW